MWMQTRRDFTIREDLILIGISMKQFIDPGGIGSALWYILSWKFENVCLFMCEVSNKQVSFLFGVELVQYSIQIISPLEFSLIRGPHH